MDQSLPTTRRNTPPVIRIIPPQHSTQQNVIMRSHDNGLPTFEFEENAAPISSTPATTTMTTDTLTTAAASTITTAAPSAANSKKKSRSSDVST